MANKKNPTKNEISKPPPGAVRPTVQLTPNMRLSESLKPSRDGFTNSVLEAEKRTESPKK